MRRVLVLLVLMAASACSDPHRSTGYEPTGPRVFAATVFAHRAPFAPEDLAAPCVTDDERLLASGRVVVLDDEGREVSAAPLPAGAAVFGPLTDCAFSVTLQIPYDDRDYRLAVPGYASEEFDLDDVYDQKYIGLVLPGASKGSRSLDLE